MKWIKLDKQEQLPKDKYILFWKHKMDHPSIMVWSYTCNRTKDEVFSSYTDGECDTMYFGESIKGNYSHFCIIQKPIQKKGFTVAKILPYIYPQDFTGVKLHKEKE